MIISDHSVRPNLRCLVTHLRSTYALTEVRIINNIKKTQVYTKIASHGYYENFSMHKAFRFLKVKLARLFPWSMLFLQIIPGNIVVLFPFYTSWIITFG